VQPVGKEILTTSPWYFSLRTGPAGMAAATAAMAKAEMAMNCMFAVVVGLLVVELGLVVVMECSDYELDGLDGNVAGNGQPFVPLRQLDCLRKIPLRSHCRSFSSLLVDLWPGKFVGRDRFRILRSVCCCMLDWLSLSSIVGQSAMMILRRYERVERMIFSSGLSPWRWSPFFVDTHMPADL
jgi:hypothetical protein